MVSHEDIHIGHVLRQARISSGLTQHELGSRMGMSQSYVSKVESGRHCLAVKESLIYAQALDISAEELMCLLVAD